MSTITIDGKRHTCLITCHQDDTFSYYIGRQTFRATEVPEEVLKDPELPEAEYLRVCKKLHWLGRLPPGLTR